ncbi:excinuclease UvrABC nuclease subunit [Streptomyces olivoverticillatus]|uniref:Excinuclease UvrABC nuclease subunit n=1 Tax=Streptomyces olivoverticillatus TaxID=66427 RepID=A0A7W7LPC2_9ACTN|nr:excinuclease UvrABC nuclease subunit [Streptomyces olivoverticillatus]
MGDKKASESAVYRLFDSTGQVLYIGMSRNPMARWGIHAEQHSWWPRVATYELAWYPTRQEAEAAEKAAIKAESPTCNVAHTPRQGQRIMAAIHRETFRPLAGHT